MPYSGLSLEGHVALVTGSARGIGAALAVGLAEAGADVAVSDIPTMLDQAKQVQEQIEGLDRTSSTYALDVLDLDSIRDSVDSVVRDFGRLDILINNAATRRPKPALELTEAEWDAVVNTNLKGVFFCAQAAARHMVEQGRGRIINIASQMALVARPRRVAYTASKAGVAGMTRALALEWIQYGVTVNAHRSGTHRHAGNAGRQSLDCGTDRRRHPTQHALGPPNGAGGTGGSRDLPRQPFGGSNHRAFAHSGTGAGRPSRVS